jgi:hypothetical protein
MTWIRSAVVAAVDKDAAPPSAVHSADFARADDEITEGRESVPEIPRLLGNQGKIASNL